MISEEKGFSVEKSGGCHDGHRQRMREKYIRCGEEGFEDHELLEMLLYYCVSRRNTNETAHGMLDRFGTLENVFAADIEELEQFDYISKNGAVLIKLVGEMHRRCLIEKAGAVRRYDSIEKVGDFLVGLFKGQNTEKLYLLTFDSGMKMLDCACISEGTIGSVNVCIRKIVEITVCSKASNVIVAHNHPGGIAIPSKNDISLTHQLENLLELIDARLLCHMIVAGDRYAPIINSMNGKFDFTV